MRDKHIIHLLDSNRFGNFSEADSLQIAAHVADCDACRQAHMHAKAAAVLLTARAEETIEPSPFFSTRVMAVIREEQSAPSLLDFFTLWKAARVFVLSAVTVVVLLTMLTFLLPKSSAPAIVLVNNSPEEAVVFGDEISRLEENPSNEQVMDVVFTPEEADATNQK